MRLNEKIPLCHDILLELLHCIVVFGAIAFDEVYLSEGSSTNDLDQLKVVQADLLVGPEQVLAWPTLILQDRVTSG